MALKYVQCGSFYLAGSGVIIGATSINLTNFTDIYGNVLTMSDFGVKGYGTIEPDTFNEEAITFTGVTANANGTYTLTGVSTNLAKSPYTETSGLIRSHVGGLKVVVSDTTAFWNTFTNKNNDEVITGNWTFNNAPVALSATRASISALGNVKLSSPALTTLGVATITIASPAVVSLTAHGLIAGDSVQFTTTGVLPTGLLTVTDYYVIATGLTANTFQVSTTVSGTAVNTTGTQSGVHTLIRTTPFATYLPNTTQDALVGGGNFGTPSASNKFVTEGYATTQLTQFGGDGSSGALSISSGTTTVDLTGLAYFELNYSSISITGTAKLAFSNPHANGSVVVIRCQGTATLTSSTTPMIDMVGIGASGGANATTSINAGAPGTDGKTFGLLKSNFGTSASASAGGTGGGGLVAAPSGGAALTLSLDVTQFNIKATTRNNPYIFVGAGGAGAGCANTTGSAGTGGRGGGCLILEIAGAINFTTTNGISVAGGVGSNASCGGNSGGAGGGGGGMCILYYKTSTALTGTINSSGGVGGSPTSSGNTGGAGGAGYSAVIQIK